MSPEKSHPNNKKEMVTIQIPKPPTASVSFDLGYRFARVIRLFCARNANSV